MIENLPREDYDSLVQQHLDGFRVEMVKQERIRAFVQGAVYSFCKNNPDKRFSGSALFGGVNRGWKGTPLEEIRNYYEGINTENSYDNSARMLGWFLASVLYNDRRIFRRFDDNPMYVEYIWLGNGRGA